jgi:hypothetical protein
MDTDRDRDANTNMDIESAELYADESDKQQNVVQRGGILDRAGLFMTSQNHVKGFETLPPLYRTLFQNSLHVKIMVSKAQRILD